MTMPRRTAGFTLIEVMITVVIVAILASVALPAYKSSVRKARRAEAHALLQAAQLGQEKFRMNNDTYASAFTDTAFSRVCTWSGSDCMSQNRYYRLTASGASASGFTLTATPQGDQANDSTCSTIVLAQTNSGMSYTPSDCWSK